MVRLKRGSDETENQLACCRSGVLSDSEATTELESESEYETGQRASKRQRKGVTSIGRRLVTRRRADRLDVTPQKQITRRALASSSTHASSSTSPPERSSDFDTDLSGDAYEQSQSPTPSAGSLLKWKNIPYPGLPVSQTPYIYRCHFYLSAELLLTSTLQQVGYAFSYASGPICFLKVPTSASKFLAAHWRPPQNYTAYIIYSLRRSPIMDNKHQGLDMVNELAARGFLEDFECDIHEEIVQDMRALSFKKGDVVVTVSKLGDATAFRGYFPGSKVDDEDRKTISDRLQSVMHDRALPKQKTSMTPSPISTRCSDESELRGTTLTASESEDETSVSSGREALLEDSDLIRLVKVHWRQSKWIADNIRNIRPSTDTKNSGEGTNNNFRAVIVWSNKAEKKDGINLLERMIVASIGGKRGNYMKDVMRCEEVMDDGEVWSVFHKKDVVVGFPGRDGANQFLESVQAEEKVWS
jgi:hypothetical protein